MKSAVTVNLVPEARSGPFVFFGDLPEAIGHAARLGFDAVEIFAPAPDAVDLAGTLAQLKAANLGVAAVGTGAGWLRHKLTLTSPDAGVRRAAVEFIGRMIDFGGSLSAPAIIGSMQGRWGDQPGGGPATEREVARGWLLEGLAELGRHAAERGQPLLYEPLNRYETNFANRLEDGLALVEACGQKNVLLLADLFHMNIEEASTPEALRRCGARVGHVHFVDSNRRPAGCGQLAFGPIVEALRSAGYAGYLSAEALGWPDPLAAAATTIGTFRRFVG